MTQSEQAVKGVFGIEKIVRPMSMKTAFGIPERVDQIETFLVLKRGQPATDTGQCVKGRRSREEIRNGHARHSDESTVGMHLGNDPIPNIRIHRETKMRNERDRGSSW